MPDLVGKTLGRYQVTALIGQGGMATVYRAHDPVLERVVAVKVMHVHLATDPAFVGRFQHEAQAVAALSHPNIVKVFDFGSEGDSHYMVMELIDGPTLATLLGERATAASSTGAPAGSQAAALSTAEILRIFPPLCSAIDYAASRGMVHRDVKPANILLTGQGQPVLTDYGIAKLMGATSYTVAGVVMGSAHYMSPEQVQGLPTDERSDIYSLGVCLFEALAGRVPYDAETTASILAQHMAARVPAVRSLNPGLPEAVQAVLEQALAKEPSGRFQRASALAAALQSALGAPIIPFAGEATGPAPSLAETVIVPAAPRVSGPAPAVRPGPAAPLAPTRVEQALVAPEAAAPLPGVGLPQWQPSRRSRRKWWKIPAAVAAVLVIGGGVAAAILLTGSPDDTATTTSATFPGGSLTSIPGGLGPVTTLATEVVQLIKDGDSLVRAGQLDQGIAKYEAALQASPNSDLALTQLGIAYYLHKGFPPDMAPQQLQLATQQNPTNGSAWSFLGLSLLTVAYDFRTGDFASAEQACRAAIKLDLRNPQAHAFLGRVLAAEGNLDEAQTEVQSGLDLGPKDPWVLVSAGWVSKLKGQWADAVPYYEQAAALQPKWAGFLILYAEALRESGEYDKAVGVYQTVLQLGQGYDASGYEGLGVTLWKRGDLVGAVANLTQSLSIDNQNDYAHWALGAVLEEQGAYDLALPHLQLAATMTPKSAGYQEWLGDCLYNLGRYAEARTAVDKALEIDPNREGAQRISGQLQQKGY